MDNATDNPWASDIFAAGPSVIAPPVGTPPAKHPREEKGRFARLTKKMREALKGKGKGKAKAQLLSSPRVRPRFSPDARPRFSPDARTASSYRLAVRPRSSRSLHRLNPSSPSPAGRLDMSSPSPAGRLEPSSPCPAGRLPRSLDALTPIRDPFDVFACLLEEPIPDHVPSSIRRFLKEAGKARREAEARQRELEKEKEVETEAVGDAAVTAKEADAEVADVIENKIATADLPGSVEEAAKPIQPEIKRATRQKDEDLVDGTWETVADGETYVLHSGLFVDHVVRKALNTSRQTTRSVVAALINFFIQPKHSQVEHLLACVRELFDEIWLGTEVLVLSSTEILKYRGLLRPTKPLLPVEHYATVFYGALEDFVLDDSVMTRANLVASTPSFFTRVLAGVEELPTRAKMVWETRQVIVVLLNHDTRHHWVDPVPEEIDLEERGLYDHEPVKDVQNHFGVVG